MGIEVKDMIPGLTLAAVLSVSPGCNSECQELTNGFNEECEVVLAEVPDDETDSEGCNCKTAAVAAITGAGFAIAAPAGGVKTVALVTFAGFLWRRWKNRKANVRS